MDLAGERFRVDEGYEVRLPPGDHLIVVAGAYVGTSSHDFDHPNLVAKKRERFDFKHYRKNGSKFWTTTAEINFYFVLPKAQIELLPEKGHSDVPVLIGGRTCRLNISGESRQGDSTDFVRSVVDLGFGWTIGALRSLAATALRVKECRSLGIRLEIEPLADGQRTAFVELAAVVAMRAKLRPGSQVLLKDGWDYLGSQGPFAVTSQTIRKQHVLCAAGLARVRIPYMAIDWIRTAEVNGAAVPGPVFVNYIDSVVEPRPV
jgi:hypothetical protein